MRFEILHTTDYRFEEPATEAYIEARLTPPSRPTQKILAHELLFDPETPVSSYTDYFGNPTSFYSMVKRHERLTVTNRILAETAPPVLPEEALDLTVGEARQIFSSVATDFFDYLRTSPAVPMGGAAGCVPTRPCATPSGR
jgi:transglutaminase-like putative cysteine protease